MKKAVDYIIDTFDFDVTKCPYPKNDWQHHKRRFYFWVKTFNEKLFFWLKEKFPIRYMKERPDGVVWLNKEINGKTIFEVWLRPFHPKQ